MCLTFEAGADTPADDPEEPSTSDPSGGLTETQVEAIQTDTQSSEDPDAQRRLERELEAEGQTPEERREASLELEWYASARVHAIDAFVVEEGNSKARLGDGASRVGATADWRLGNGWNVFGRLESGFDVLDTFTGKAQDDGSGFFRPRLYNVALETDHVYAKLGKSWSVYYKVAGAADRFSIFGGSAAGVYNAGTDGGATGTGRADDAFQTLVYVDVDRWLGIRPFNLNVQYQPGQSIPGAMGSKYRRSWSASAWQETEGGLGIGLAWHRAELDDPLDPRLQGLGIDGDAEAFALALKTTGKGWFVSLVLSRLDDVETTDQGLYFEGDGVELFGQWQFRDRWWLVTGGNWLEPKSGEFNRAGDYRIRYGVLGVRYEIDDFNRMVYAEWRIDDSRQQDGSRRDDEFTIGIRWDFGD